ncbi:MAG TPA: hypothetical protein VFV78_14890 [Vicinamibacterales bacterium]|nr:hypothetical protein [Vicinamibacterales bacterium]
MTYRVTPRYLELTAAGFGSAEDALAAFRAIRADEAVPEGLPWLMDLRQYDHRSITPEDMPARVQAMFDTLGSKLGQFWAVVIDAQIEHLTLGRLLQRLVNDRDATVMLFPDVAEAREWLEAMTLRRAASRSSLPST